ncbi:MAG: hypothetical protein GWN01_10105, partial [Nitrosopumilaceae archaeon]|nr:endolytic transglycosylase MltG [Nitrosopumilaceae archaeon]NIX61856.1 hypothetical protein [Nitrosopumilaceae archaeon]
MSRKRPNASLEKISLICSRIGFVLYLVGNLILYFFKKIRLITFFIGIGLALLIVLSFFIFQPLPENKETNPKVKLYIPSGATFRQVTDSLQKHNLLKHRQLFL